MRRGSFLCAVLSAAVVLFSLPAGEARAAGLSAEVSAESAVLIAADTGQVLFEKDSHRPMSVASTTKIMTALLTLEEAARSGDREVTVTDEMVRVEGTSMGLMPGDRLSLTALAQGMLLASGNDAANAAAITLDGSLDAFAARMNDRAAALGMADTHFVTPSGLDEGDHHSTAYDMALLAAEAIKFPAFREICSSAEMSVAFAEPQKSVAYSNHNKLLSLYEGCIGVKTGFTKKAGRCLVSAAEREGVTLCCVTLDAPDDWNDHIALLDLGFSAMTALSFDGRAQSFRVPVVGGAGDAVSAQGVQGGAVSLLKEDAQRVTTEVLLPAFLYAPVEAGDTVGRVVYRVGDREIYSLPIVTGEDVAARMPEPGHFEKVRRWLRKHLDF